jgi:hypothetical protein
VKSAPTCGDEMRKRHLQTTPLFKPNQPAAAGDYSVIWSVQNSTVLSRPAEHTMTYWHESSVEPFQMDSIYG